MTCGMCMCVLALCLLILEVTDVNSLSDPAKRVCVIGAGYSGLGTARHLTEHGVNYTVFEASRHIGGTWRFDPQAGTDQDGLPLYTSMYKQLRTNTPRQTMEYVGYKFPEDTPTYPTGDCFYKYLKSFAKHFDLLKNIQLQRLVTSVDWAGDHWDLTYMKTDTKENITEVCDFVVVANGICHKVALPKFEGQEVFKGKMIHSHDYKDAEPYRNRRVLLIGAGASGLDLATHLCNVTSKLFHSHHLKYNQPFFSENYLKKPDIKTFTENGAVFEDDTTEEFDDVIFCTGYDFDHPFITDTTGVTTSKKFVLPLYQQVVNIKHPSMAFVGVSKKVINRVLDAQGEYAAMLAAGKFELPSQEEMLRNWLDHVHALRWERKMKLVDVNVVPDMDQYFGNLTREAGVNRAPPVLTSIRDFNAKNRLDDLLNYRDYDYKIIDNLNYERFYNRRKELSCPFEG